MARQSTIEKVIAPKKKKKGVRISPVFRNSQLLIPNLTTYPSSPAVREPVSVVITVDHLTKKGAVMQKAKFGHGKPRMDRTLRRGALPCIRRSRSLYRERVVGDAVLVSTERKKVMKTQRRSKKSLTGK
jgi:hypothetical protein